MLTPGRAPSCRSRSSYLMAIGLIGEPTTLGMLSTLETSND
jgi:hypothetical protein